MDKYHKMIFEERGPLIQAPFQFLIENKLSILEYMILTLINDESYDLLNVYHERVEPVRDNVIALVEKGFLFLTDPKEDFSLENLTMSKSLNLIMLNSNVSSWIDDWWNLWPDGIKSSNYYVKTDKNGCIKKLEKFRRKYPQFTASLILDATRNYINRMSIANYSFMKLAPYFVEKDGLSTLAGECEQIISESSHIGEIVKPKFGEITYGG